jgi:hypothetical protein
MGDLLRVCVTWIKRNINGYVPIFFTSGFRVFLSWKLGKMEKGKLDELMWIRKVRSKAGSSKFTVPEGALQIDNSLGDNSDYFS